MEKFVNNTIKQIKEQVGSKKVVLGLSGGVDSSVRRAIRPAPGSRRSAMEAMESRRAEARPALEPSRAGGHCPCKRGTSKEAVPEALRA